MEQVLSILKLGRTLFNTYHQRICANEFCRHNSQKNRIMVEKIIEVYALSVLRPIKIKQCLMSFVMGVSEAVLLDPILIII